MYEAMNIKTIERESKNNLTHQEKVTIFEPEWTEDSEVTLLKERKKNLKQACMSKYTDFHSIYVTRSSHILRPEFYKNNKEKQTNKVHPRSSLSSDMCLLGFFG